MNSYPSVVDAHTERELLLVRRRNKKKIVTTTETKKKKSLQMNLDQVDQKINDSRLERRGRRKFSIESRWRIDLLTVSGYVDFIGHFSNLYFETFLDFAENGCVTFIGNICNGQTFGTEPTSTCNLESCRELDQASNEHPLWTYSMEVSIRAFCHIVIEYNIHTFDVHTSPEQIRGDENTCLEFFEFLVTCQAKRRQETLALPGMLSMSSTNRSSWAMPRWISTAGKFCSVRSLHRAVHRGIDLTKMTTWLNSNLSSRSINLRFFSFSRNFT